MLSFYERFARKNTANPRLQAEAGWAYRRVAVLYQRLGRDDESEKAFARAWELLEPIASSIPEGAVVQSKLVRLCLSTDPWSADPTGLAVWIPRLERSLVLLEQSSAAGSEDLNAVDLLVQAELRLGIALQKTGKLSQAQGRLRRAIEHEDEIIERFDSGPRRRFDRAAIRYWLALALWESNEAANATGELDSAASELEWLVRGNDVPQMVLDRLAAVARLYEALGNPTKAKILAGLASARRPGRPPRMRPRVF